MTTKEQILNKIEPRTVKIIEFANSWGTDCGENGYQVITEEYFTSGNIWCAWTITEKDNVIVPTFKYKWTKTMKLGQSSTDVKALQKALKLLGLFPESQTATGYFGKVTKDAVVKFQTRYELQVDGIAGPKTYGLLNELYA